MFNFNFSFFNNLHSINFINIIVMSDKKEITNGSSTNEQPQGSVNTERPQSVYITNSDQSGGRDKKKSKE